MKRTKQRMARRIPENHKATSRPAAAPSITVRLERSSIHPGQAVKVYARCEPQGAYTALDAVVFTTGFNSEQVTAAWGDVSCADGEYSTELQLKTFAGVRLKPAVYEIRAVRLSSSSAADATKREWRPQGRHDRIFLEVSESPREVSASEVAAEVASAERVAQEQYLRPVRAAPEHPDDRKFTAYVFVQGVLIGNAYHSGNFSFGPLSVGVETRDAWKIVNGFLRDQIGIPVPLPYPPELEKQARLDNPVSVFEFPCLIAAAPEQARDYAHKQTQIALLGLALTRSASGTVFHVTVLDADRGRQSHYVIPRHYAGNILRGPLGGDSPREFEQLMAGLREDPINQFLVNNFRQALAEPVPDFQYLRFWQLLEIMTELRGYRSSDPLLTYSGDPMLDARGQSTLGQASVNRVFTLLRECEIADHQTAWQQTNTWFALRTAVAHHGAVHKYGSLSRDDVREWAEKAHERATATGQDSFLLELRFTVEHCLRRKVQGVAPWQSQAAVQA